MTEQQRVVLAMAACMGIIAVFGWLRPPAAAPPPAAPTAPQGPSGGEPAAARAAPPSVDAPPVAETLPFHVSWGDGALTPSRAAISALTLRDFRAPPAEAESRSGAPLAFAGADSRDGLQAQLFIPGGAEVLWQAQPEPDGTLGLAATVAGRPVRLEARPRPEGFAIDYRLSAEPGGGDGVPLPFALRLSQRLPPPAPRSFLSSLAPGPAAGEPLVGICQVAGRTRRFDGGQVEKKEPELMGRVAWGAIDRQYFVLAAAATGEPFTSCRMRSERGFLIVDLGLPPLAPAGDGGADTAYTLFAGPKRDAALAQVVPSLRDTLDYTVLGVPLGFLARPMVFLLGHFHDLTRSWGAAIALLTLVVKALLFPVTYKSIVSMRRMQAIKPELDRLRQTFADDPERQSQEQLKLLREHNANPLGGCLPAVLQMPVWLALYNMLRHAVDLYQQPFLWLTDLKQPEPFPVLALTVGALTLVQQKMTPMAVDGAQAKIMMYALPVMFTAFMFAMPSGLVVYILVNSVLTIAQQVAINRFSAAPKRT